MATGQEMLIRSLCRALGIDDAMLEQIKWMVETVRSFDERLKRVERLVEVIAKGSTPSDNGEPTWWPQPDDGHGQGNAGTGLHGTLAQPGSGNSGGGMSVPGPGADIGKPEFPAVQS